MGVQLRLAAPLGSHAPPPDFPDAHILTPGSQSSLGPFAKPGGNRNLPHMEFAVTPRLYRAGPLSAAFAGNDAAQTAEFYPPPSLPGADSPPQQPSRQARGELVAGVTAAVNVPGSRRGAAADQRHDGRVKTGAAFAPLTMCEGEEG
jgi:hypothetical protein